jgi:REP element-mobilizing transposase RayT
MPQSLAAVYLHIVFSTKHRLPLITADLAPRLYAYIGGIARGNKNVLLHSGGMPDHVHLLVSIGRTQSIADMVGSLKSGSSRWVHDTFPDRRDFEWQMGYGVFSVGPTQLKDVRGYIDRQEEHHAKKSFQEEFLDFLRWFEIEYDERYVWD